MAIPESTHQVRLVVVVRILPLQRFDTHWDLVVRLIAAQ